MTKKSTAVIYLGAIASLFLAILLYRGGNYANDGLNFQWTTNFISDLGLTTSQPLVRGLFGVGMLLTGLAVVRVCANKRRFQLGSAILLMVLGVAITIIPADLHLILHRDIFVLLLITTAVLWSTLIKSVLGDSIYKKISTALAAAVLWAYLIFIFVAPRPETSLHFSMIHAQVEKTAFVIFLLSLAVLVFDSPKPITQL